MVRWKTSAGSVVVDCPSDGAAVVQGVLPRQSMFVRRAAGEEAREQVVAANVNVAFLVTGLDQDFNLRRIERYLTLAWDSGASPVIILNKADMCEDVQAHVEDVMMIAPGVPIHAVSATVGDGMDPVAKSRR